MLPRLVVALPGIEIAGGVVGVVYAFILVRVARVDLFQAASTRGGVDFPGSGCIGIIAAFLEPMNVLI